MQASALAGGCAAAAAAAADASAPWCLLQCTLEYWAKTPASLAPHFTRGLCILVAGAGSLPSWYYCSCTPVTSGTPCVCPSTAALGNLPAASVPQFVLYTVSVQLYRVHDL